MTFFDFFFGPPPVTRDQLGKLGRVARDPFDASSVAPPYDPINAIEHGIAPDWARYERERGDK